MRYEKAGSGTTLFIEKIGVKRKSLYRQVSFSKLQKQLGVYEPPTLQHESPRRENEPLKSDLPGWNDYIREKKAHEAARNEAKLALQKRHEQERRERLRGNWKGKGSVLNTMRSVIAAEQAAAKVALKEKHQEEREKKGNDSSPILT